MKKEKPICAADEYRTHYKKEDEGEYEVQDNSLHNDYDDDFERKRVQYR